MQIIRAPLIIFPFAFSALSDALVALTRISTFLTAEELEEPYRVECGQETALEVDGDFTWEISRTAGPVGSKADKADKRHSFRGNKAVGGLPMSAAEGKFEGEDAVATDEEKPFELNGIKLDVPTGSFVAIVGRVGCGKVRAAVSCQGVRVELTVVG